MVKMSVYNILMLIQLILAIGSFLFSSSAYFQRNDTIYKVIIAFSERRKPCLQHTTFGACQGTVSWG